MPYTDDSFSDGFIDNILGLHSEGEADFLRSHPTYNKVYSVHFDEIIVYCLGNIEDTQLTSIFDARYMRAYRKGVRYDWAWAEDEVLEGKYKDFLELIFNSVMDPIKLSDEMNRIKKLLS